MIVFIGYICLKIYQESEAFQLKCIISKIDGNEYCVRETSKLELVADILARAKRRLNEMSDKRLITLEDLILKLKKKRSN